MLSSHLRLGLPSGLLPGRARPVIILRVYMQVSGESVSDSKSCPATCHGGTSRERRYSSYSYYFTSALDRGEWSASRPGRALPPGDPRYPLDGRLGGPQSRSGRRG
jgi:hypothetical protein